MCVGESVSKSSYKTVELEACWLDKECALLKGKLRGLTKKLCDPLQLSGMDSIVARSILCQEWPPPVHV